MESKEQPEELRMCLNAYGSSRRVVKAIRLGFQKAAMVHSTAVMVSLEKAFHKMFIMYSWKSLCARAKLIRSKIEGFRLLSPYADAQRNLFLNL